MKKSSLIIIDLFLGMLALFSIGSIVKQDLKFSDNENRVLAELPHPTVKHIVDGTFQEDLETYLQDQILFRDGWIATRSALLLSAGDNDIGGAYVGKDGYDFEKITPAAVDEKRVKANAKAVRTFFDANEKTVGREHESFLLVPTSGLVLSDKLPKYAPMFDQDTAMDTVLAEMDGIRTPDLRSLFSAYAAGDDLYYHTDHHWKSHGAYLAYHEWNEDSPAEDKYEITTVTEKFLGTLYSKVLNINSVYDSIERYDLPDADADAITVTADGKELPGIYDESKLKEKDKYTYFFGGNYGVTEITNPVLAEKSKKPGRLLVVKDSFANAFVPLAAQEYPYITMIDLRYFRGNVNDYIKDNNVTDILVLYNISNFISDKNLFKLNLGEK